MVTYILRFQEHRKCLLRETSLPTTLWRFWLICMVASRPTHLMNWPVSYQNSKEWNTDLVNFDGVGARGKCWPRVTCLKEAASSPGSR